MAFDRAAHPGAQALAGRLQHGLHTRPLSEQRLRAGRIELFGPPVIFAGGEDATGQAVRTMERPGSLYVDAHGTIAGDGYCDEISAVRQAEVKVLACQVGLPRRSHLEGDVGGIDAKFPTDNGPQDGTRRKPSLPGASAGGRRELGGGAVPTRVGDRVHVRHPGRDHAERSGHDNRVSVAVDSAAAAYGHGL